MADKIINPEESISIVIPIYNSGTKIKTIIGQINDALKDKIKYEILLVNDGSRDDSYKNCKDLSLKYGFVKFIDLSKKFGRHNAILAGLHYIKGDYVVCMYDSFPTHPGEIWKLIKEIKKGYDVVYASFIQDQGSWLTVLGRKIKNMAIAIFLVKSGKIEITGFFIIKRFLVDEIIKYTGPFSFLGGLILRATNNIGKVLIRREKGKYLRSGYSHGNIFNDGLNGITNFSISPLRISFFFGSLCSVTGFIFSIIFIIRKIINPDTVLGWTSIIIAILLFSGLILITLGFIGEYVGRTFLSLNKHPQFIIKEKFNIKQKQ